MKKLKPKAAKKKVKRKIRKRTIPPSKPVDAPVLEESKVQDSLPPVQE